MWVPLINRVYRVLFLALYVLASLSLSPLPSSTPYLSVSLWSSGFIPLPRFICIHPPLVSPQKPWCTWGLRRTQSSGLCRRLCSTTLWTYTRCHFVRQRGDPLSFIFVAIGWPGLRSANTTWTYTRARRFRAWLSYSDHDWCSSCFSCSWVSSSIASERENLSWKLPALMVEGVTCKLISAFIGFNTFRVPLIMTSLRR